MTFDASRFPYAALAVALAGAVEPGSRKGAAFQGLSIGAAERWTECLSSGACRTKPSSWRWGNPN
jgi:hypothetical protein